MSTYITCAVVADDEVDEADEEVLDILAPAVGQVGAERVQDHKIFVGCVEQRLRQKHDHQADQTDPVWIVLRVVVVARLHDADAGLPDELIVDSAD